MNRVIHFEIQADDVERARRFYQTILGWKINQVMTKEQGGMDYWMIETGEGPGINGGLYQRSQSEDEKLYLYDCTIQVEDLDKTVESVKMNGGVITREKSMIPGVGWFAGAKDPEGNRFGLMQATEWKPE
jgi:predicted enzyme related to lactoylglutathione lyase